MRIKLTFLNSNMALCNISEIIPRLLIGVILNLLLYFFSFQKHLGYHWIFSTALLTLEALFTYYERESERISRSVVSSSLRPHVLWPTRLLCPWGFSRQEYWSGAPCPPPGDLSDQGWNPRLLHCRQVLYHWAATVHQFKSNSSVVLSIVTDYATIPTKRPFYHPSKNYALQPPLLSLSLKTCLFWSYGWTHEAVLYNWLFSLSRCFQGPSRL